MATLINPGGPGPRGQDAFLGESHMWAASTSACAHCDSALGFFDGQPAKVVVDLGKRSSGAGVRAADFNPGILILTHSDDDHIGGFEALANAWPDRLRQLWVPYEWGLLAETRAALAGAEHPDPIHVLHPEEIRRLGEADVDLTQLPAAVVRNGEHRGRRPDLLLGIMDRAEGPLLVRERVGVRESQILEDVITEVIERERESNPSWPPGPKPEKAHGVAKDVIKKADLLLGILAEAASRGVDVRYFSTDAVRDDRPTPWTIEGMAGIATIVNAAEVELVPARFLDPAWSLYLAYELTVQNRRALAVYLWERSCLCGVRSLLDAGEWERVTDIPMTVWAFTAAHHSYFKPWGVLIWSDGAGESCRVGGAGGVQNDLVPWEHIAAMTAPHHGSKGVAHRRIWAARAEAQDVLGREIPLLLAGGTGSQRTAPEYLAVNRELRACIRCRHLGDSSSKTVVLAVDGPTVTMTPGCRD